MKAGDRIRLSVYVLGATNGCEDYTVEEFRHALGIFRSEHHRQAQRFIPLCDLYEPGPEAEECFLPRFGIYHSEYVPVFMNLPRRKHEQEKACTEFGGSDLAHRNRSSHLPSPGIPLVCTLDDGSEVDAIRPGHVSDRSGDPGYYTAQGDPLSGVEYWRYS